MSKTYIDNNEQITVDKRKKVLKLGNIFWKGLLIFWVATQKIIQIPLKASNKASVYR